MTLIEKLEETMDRALWILFCMEEENFKRESDFTELQIFPPDLAVNLYKFKNYDLKELNKRFLDDEMEDLSNHIAKIVNHLIISDKKPNYSDPEFIELRISLARLVHRILYHADFVYEEVMIHEPDLT